MNIPGMDPAVAQALNMDEDFWALGDKPAVVETESGSRYIAQSDGSLSNGTISGQLNGSIYRPGGPIRLNVIVYGMRMEIRTGPAHVATTTPVVKIEDAQ